MLATGLFMHDDPVMQLNNGREGLFIGGGFGSLGVQTLAIVSIIAWSAFSSYVLLMVSKLGCGLWANIFLNLMTGLGVRPIRP